MKLGKYLSVSLYVPMGISSCKKCKGIGFIKMYWLEWIIKSILTKTPLKFSRKSKPCSCMFYAEISSSATMIDSNGKILLNEEFSIV